MSMTGKIEQVEVITSVQRRRRWSAEEKARIGQRPTRRESRFRSSPDSTGCGEPGISYGGNSMPRHCAPARLLFKVNRDGIRYDPV